MKKNRDIAIAAVRQNGLALEFAEAELKKDKTVVGAAVRSEGRSLEFADAELINQKLDFVGADMIKHRAIVVVAIRQNGCGLRIRYRRAEERDFILATVREIDGTFEFARLRPNKTQDTVLAAVRQDAAAIS